MKTTLSLRITLLFLSGVASQAQFATNSSSGTIDITGYSGPGGAVIVPSTINGITVTAIGAGAFELTACTSITIPATVTSIGDYAFYDCSSLTAMYFEGNAPHLDPNSAGFVFYNDQNSQNIDPTVAYYLPETTGWNTFNSDADIPANPNTTNYTVTASASPFNGGAVSGATNTYAGTPITVTAVATGGNLFSNWTINGAAVSTNPSYTFPLLSNVSLVANFIVSYSITLGTFPTNGGSVTGAGTNFQNAQQTITATASNGYVFTNWTLANGVVFSASSNFNYSVTSNLTLVANFNPIIAAAAYPTNGGTVEGTGDFPYSSNQTVTAIANPGFTFTGWATNTNGTVISTSAAYTFDLLAPVSLIANFSPGLQVLLSPSNAVAAGAQWQLDGVSQTNGVALTNLTPGTYLISFQPAPGWTPPRSQMVTISNNSPIAVTGVYTPSSSPTNTLVLVTNGFGTIQHANWTQPLVPGNRYTVRAVPAAKNIFVNWTAGTNPPYTVLSTSPSYTFPMEPSLVLQANFLTNVFQSSIAGGTYRGLFAPTNDHEQTNSGAFLFTISTTGTVSGNLQMAGQTLPFSGKFNPDGSTNFTVRRPRGATPLTMNLLLDIPSQTVSGTVSNGSSASQLFGNRDAFSATNPATNFEGHYTLIIEGTNNTNAGPFGASYGTATINRLGAITFSGSLADGTAISQSSVISSDGYWPLYINLYGGKGSLWSWNYISNQTITGAPVWINSGYSRAGAALTSGFTNQSAVLMGGTYVPITAQPRPTNEAYAGEESGLTLYLNNPPVTTTNFPIEFDYTTVLPYTNIPSIITPAPAALKLKIAYLTTGLITGSFGNPAATNRTIKFNGVLLQGATNAAGYFLDSDQSGLFQISTTPFTPPTNSTSVPAE